MTITPIVARRLMLACLVVGAFTIGVGVGTSNWAVIAFGALPIAGAIAWLLGHRTGGTK